MVSGACSGPTFESGSNSGGRATVAGTSGAGAGGTGAGGKGGGAAGRDPTAGSSGTSAGRGGAGGHAGSAGRGGSGDAGQATGGGELGGEAGVGVAGANGGCSCGPGQYCRGEQCFDCSDLSQLDFATPEQILDHPSSALRFPRPGDVPGSLFFTLGSNGEGELWYEASVAEPPGGPLGDAMTPGRSGLYYFDDPDNSGFNALFDEQDEGGRRSLRAARFVQGALASIDMAPSPLTPGDFDDYSVALAPLTGRFFWMSTRDGEPTLRTGLLGTSDADVVDVVAQGPSGTSCTLAADAPWVNDDGSLLVVSAPALDAACQPVDGGATDLYAAPVSTQTGKLLAPAIPLGSVNVSRDLTSETDAAFSSDLCTLYFASDGGSPSGFDFTLFRAARR